MGVGWRRAEAKGVYALVRCTAAGGGDEAEAALRAALREVREALTRAETALVTPPQSSSRRALEEGTV